MIRSLCNFPRAEDTWVGWESFTNYIVSYVKIRDSVLEEIEQFRADCVTQRMLREWNYRSYYHAEISADEQKHLGSHIGIRVPFRSKSRGTDSSNAPERI